MLPGEQFVQAYKRFDNPSGTLFLFVDVNGSGFRVCGFEVQTVCFHLIS